MSFTEQGSRSLSCYGQSLLPELGLFTGECRVTITPPVTWHGENMCIFLIIRTAHRLNTYQMT